MRAKMVATEDQMTTSMNHPDISHVPGVIVMILKVFSPQEGEKMATFSRTAFFINNDHNIGLLENRLVFLRGMAKIDKK
jgi:hypothetical protein